MQAKMMHDDKTHFYSLLYKPKFTYFVSAISFHFALSVGCPYKQSIFEKKTVSRILFSYCFLNQYLKGGSGYLYFQELIICRLRTSRYMQNWCTNQNTCVMCPIWLKGNRREIKKNNTLGLADIWS